MVNMSVIWSEFLLMAREEAGSHVVETWLQALHFYSWDEKQATACIRAPNAFVMEWVSQKYIQLLERSLVRLLRTVTVRVVLFVGELPPALAQTVEKEPEPTSPFKIIPTVRAPARTRKRVEQDAVSSLQSGYRFDTFVVGSHNSLAYAAAHAVVEKLGTLYNPFFIYGTSGLGKTHLLHAIGNAVHARSAQTRVVYQNANRFVTDFINAIRFDRVHHFELQYRNVDLLLMDDVQSLAHKEQTQEAFFHLFNVLHQARKQIVCTSDSLPRDIAGLAERIRSRLASGLIADISQPTLETKIAIVKRKAEAQGELISDEVAERIASIETTNIRDLEGALIRLLAFASLTKRPISVELTREVLEPHYRLAKPEKDLSIIAEAVASHFKYSLATLCSGTRQSGVVFARHVAMALMKRVAGASLREISFCLQRKDHSTVMHALEKMDRLEREDESCRKLLRQLEKQLHT